MKTYTRMSRNALQFARQALQLYQVRNRTLGASVQATLAEVRRVSEQYEKFTGEPLKDKKVLILGSGQTPREVLAFGALNQVTAIDLDVIPQGLNPWPYVQLFRQNGPERAAKTIGRKLLGIDRRFIRALTRALGTEAKPRAVYRQMDAARMSLPDESFALVYSFSVFEHLPEPEKVLREALRVLRPGGLLCVSVHLYTSEGGAHDLRIFSGDREMIPWWAQLRPDVKHTITESCYMNEWRLEPWRQLFESCCPGVTLTTQPHDGELGKRLQAELKTLRAAGELAAYSDEELLSVNLRATFFKPVHG